MPHPADIADIDDIDDICMFTEDLCTFVVEPAHVIDVVDVIGAPHPCHRSNPAYVIDVIDFVDAPTGPN